jgi:RND family efflux transporter MFP subunit
MTPTLTPVSMKSFFLLLMIWFSNHAYAQEMPPMPVIVAQPEIKELVQYDEFTGRFQAFQEVDVRARVSGYLEKIHFKDGQYIHAGDLLFSIDPKPFQAVVAVARAELQRVETELVLAEQEVERAHRLVKIKAMSQEELDTRTASLNIALANIQSAKAALTTALLDLDYTKISAPISGRISNRRIDIGNLIESGGSQTLTTIVTEQPLYVIFDVSEADYLKYQRRIIANKQDSMSNSELEVNVRLLDETTFQHTGKLNFIDNQLDDGTSTIRLRATIEDHGNGLLVPGMFGRVQIPINEKQATMLIPDKAVLSDMANKIVMTVNADNIVVPKPVQLGALYEGKRIITAGLTTEDKVVIEGIFRARPGATVMPQLASEQAPAAEGQ